MTAPDRDTPDDGVTPLPRPFVHGLMNQLCAILGHAELLLEDLPEDAPQRADVLAIRDACQKAIDLADGWGGK